MRLLFLLASGIYLLASFVLPARAETLTSPSYKVRLGNFNMTSGLKSSTTYSLTDTVGQTAAGLFSGSGYAVLAGFQYIYTLYDFSFRVTNLSVDFGSLTPSSFATASHDLIVSAPGQGYSVTTYATTRLESNGNYIPDTTCNTSCDESTAGVWTSTSAYGFGYNMSGHDVPATFADSPYFRPFPDFSLAENPATVMTTTAAGRDRTATVTYKLNTSGSQAAGDYQTQIVYIATPVY